MPVLLIPCVLCFNEIRIILGVIRQFYLLKAEIRLGRILPAPGGGIAPVANSTTLELQLLEMVIAVSCVCV